MSHLNKNTCDKKSYTHWLKLLFKVIIGTCWTLWPSTFWKPFENSPRRTPWDPRLHHAHKVCLSGISLMVSDGVSVTQKGQKKHNMYTCYRVIFCFEICMTCFVSNLFSCTTTVKPPKMEQDGRCFLICPFRCFGWVWGSHVSFNMGGPTTQQVILKKSFGVPTSNSLLLRILRRRRIMTTSSILKSFMMDPTEGRRWIFMYY